MSNKIQGETYKERVKDQTLKWANGESIHNHIDNECCPDFSCCNPELKQHEEIRKTFLSASKDKQEGFISSFDPKWLL